MTENQANASNEALILARSPRFTTSVSGNRLLLANESDAHILDGSIYIDIATALLPALPWTELRDKLRHRYSLAEIEMAVVVLTQIGYVRRPSASRSPAEAAWWEALGLDPASRAVSIEPLCTTGLQQIEEALAACDISVSPDAAFRLVLTDDYLRPELSEINRQGKPWLLAKPTGHSPWIGPVFVPGRPPCWECMAWWLRMNRWKQWTFHGWRDGHYPPQPSLAYQPATLAIAAGIIATATAIALAAGDHPEIAGAVLTYDTRTTRQSRHSARPIPGCRTCGGGPLVQPKDLRVFISNLTGVVNSLEVSSEPAGGLFHAHGVFVNALPAVRTSQIVRPGSAFGKGITVEAAETACVAEAIERYSLTWRGDQPLVEARFGDLDAIHPNAIGQYSAAQFRTRAASNRGQESMFWVPASFDPATPVGWVACRSVREGRMRHVLAAAVFYGYPFENGEPYFISDSNGCAAGRTIEEALAAALFELIERDALAIWWYNRIRRPSVPLAAIAHLHTDQIIEALHHEGRMVQVLDITTDLNVPAYAAVAAKRDGSDVVFASAAHICPQRAAYKALSEVSQIAYWKSRAQPASELADWLRVANTQLPEFDWLVPAGLVAPPAPSRMTPSEAIAECVDRLRRAGVESYWVDLTRSEIGVPVVRVIAPGLRNHWARFAPGRLYDVPVSLGWLAEPTAEPSLNPIPCIL